MSMIKYYTILINITHEHISLIVYPFIFDMLTHTLMMAASSQHRRRLDGREIRSLDRIVKTAMLAVASCCEKEKGAIGLYTAYTHERAMLHRVGGAKGAREKDRAARLTGTAVKVVRAHDNMFKA